MQTRPQAALHRLQQLRAGLSVRRAEDETRVRADDEVRHVLRPHLGRARSRCAPRSAPAGRCSSARARRSSSCGRAVAPVNRFQFGEQTITTKVNMMVPRDGRAELRRRAPPAMERAGRAASPWTCCSAPMYARGRGRMSTRDSGRADARRPTAGRERAAGLAARFPHRLAAGPLRRPARLHQVPGADQPGVRRSAVWIGVQNWLRGAAGRPPIAGRSPASMSSRSAARCRSTTPANTIPACCCGPTRQRSWPTARNARTCAAPWCRASTAASSTARATTALRPGDRPAARRAAAPAAAASSWRGRGGSSTPPAWRTRSSPTMNDVPSPASSGRPSSTASSAWCCPGRCSQIWLLTATINA